MSLSEQQQLLAKLYTDPNFRAAFVSDPVREGSALGLTADEIRDISSVAEREISHFADSLVWKRLREVEKKLPQTVSAMGDEFEKEFFRYSPSFNPTGIKKHYEDSVAFCSYLKSSAHVSGSARKTAAAESAKLSFFAEARSIRVCRTGPRFYSFTVWLRFGSRVIHFSL